jgi:hypothetical protein
VTFKIPGSAITGNVSVGITAAGMYTITFKSSDTTLGKINNSSESSKAYYAGATISADDFTVTPAAGYKVVWIGGEDPVGRTVTESKTYVATFEKATYDVTWADQNVKDANANKAIYDRDLIVTPTGNGVIVTGVTYTVAGTYEDENKQKLKTQTATKNADGSYTIAGSTITGNITITVETEQASFEFISYSQYQGLKGGTQIAVLKLTNVNALDTKNKWYLDDGTTQTVFLWSQSYGAYLAIVDKSETAGTLTAKLVCGTYSEADKGENNDYDSFKLHNDGDVNRDGNVDIYDIALIDDVLLSGDKCADRGSAFDINRLEMDVSSIMESGKTDRTVSVVDIDWILAKANGTQS